MTRMTIALVLTTGLLTGTAAAQTLPATQTPPRPMAPPATPQTATPPAPKPVAVPFPADAKVAFVNMQAIVNETKLGKAGQDQMKRMADQKTAEQTTLNKQIQTLQNELQTQSSILAPAVVTSKTADLDRMTRQAQFMQQQAQSDLETLQNRLFDDFTAKVLPVIEKLREEKGLWVIFAAGEGTGIAAMHPGVDLSEEVVKRVDATIK
jgi:outer membrane protein